ncbi:MAG: hypothetical protein ABSD73_01820 [Candidatus Bathyarchaeia archaeon]|jgi:hypothetical protein
MKVQTKGESDWKKKELEKLHKLDILKSTSAPRKPKPISTVSASATMEERGYPGTTVYIASAMEVFFLRRAQVLQ